VIQSDLAIVKTLQSYELTCVRYYSSPRTPLVALTCRLRHAKGETVMVFLALQEEDRWHIDPFCANP